VHCQKLTVGGVASSDEKWHFGIIKECLQMWKMLRGHITEEIKSRIHK
jgi:hypothetical protein